MHNTTCFTEETAERFAMNRLGLADMGACEEHLLVCSRCMFCVEAADEHIAIFRAVASGV